MFDRRLWQEARQERRFLLLTIAGATIAGLATVFQAYALSQIVNGVFLEGLSRAEIQSPLLWFVFALLVRSAAIWAGDTAAGYMAVAIESGLRDRLAAHLLTLGPVSIAAEQTGELVNTLTGGIEALEAYFSQYLPGLFVAILVPSTILLAVFPRDLLSGVVLLVTAPLIPLFMWLIGHNAEKITRRQWRQLSLMSGHFLDVLQGLTTLKQLGQSAAQIQNVARISERFRQKTMEVLRVTFLSSLVLELLATVSVAIIAVEIGLRLLAGELSFAAAFFVLVLAPEFYLPLRTLGARFHAGMEGKAAANRIYALLDSAEPAGPAATTLPDAPFTIEFQGVTATYAQRHRPALSDLSLRLSPGETVALVGASGAGKSTVVALLLRFLRPQTGEILVNGIPLQQIPATAWRRSLALVPQHPYLFHDTVATNIRLARPAAGDADVKEAARQAGADGFIEALPQGYQTVIGEQGARLSGGQAQRLALARAILSEAPLLVLDEPTAHLDHETEAVLAATTSKWMAARTVLVIAHRLSTVRQADRVIMLDQGQIVAEGTHEALIAANDAYRRLLQGEDRQAPTIEARLPALTSASIQGAAPLSRPSKISRQAAAPRQLLALLAPYRWRIVLAVLLGALTIGSSIGLLATSAYLISAAALRPSIADLGVAIVGVRFFGLARGVFRYLERLVSHDLTFRLLARVRTWFYASLEPLAPARLLHYRAGDLLNRILSDVAALEPFYVRALAPPLVALVITAATFLFMSTYALSLALALLFFLLLSGAGLTLFIRRTSAGPARSLLQSRAALQGLLVDMLQGMVDLLAYGQETEIRRRIRRLNQTMTAARHRLSWLEGTQAAMLQFFTGMAMWVVLLLAIPLVQNGAIDGRHLAVLALATMAAFEAVQPLPAAARYLESSYEAAERLFSVVAAEPAVPEPAVPRPLPKATPNLTVRHLYFRYERKVPWVLQDVSFDLPPGKRLAIVGPSGAGKSTLGHLLLRFWDSEHGEICLNGEPLTGYAGHDIRRLIGVIAQKTYLFNASIKDNLRVALPEATDVDIEAAARQAQIHDFIRSLPEGYQTLVGDQGMQLSGGQRQRLAVARSLLRKTPILLLDEPTTALDPHTGRQLLETILQQNSGRSVILITHQLVGMEQMDEILVLNRGRIIERGCHNQLLAQDGLYRRLWELQHAHF